MPLTARPRAASGPGMMRLVGTAAPRRWGRKNRNRYHSLSFGVIAPGAAPRAGKIRYYYSIAAPFGGSGWRDWADGVEWRRMAQEIGKPGGWLWR